ncbi:hypothetical protein AB0D67_12190 [Streptosporangium sp. NPDC048047]|uniref:hypothetical protein n=1 Tax=Streptosporangium sp. NPDC048047 TaxID=3155748 RepID=UPI003415BD47
MTATDSRAALVKGLVDLAAFLAANPGVPVPAFPTLYYFARGTDTAIRAEIDRIATLLGLHIDPEDAAHGHRRIRLDFGPVRYEAVGILTTARTATPSADRTASAA